MSITEEEVKYIAKLAKLKIEEQDLPKHAKSLSNIFDMFSQMSGVNTDSIEPMAHPMELYQRTRHDEVTEQDQHETLQTIAPLTEANLYLVPKVIENE